MMMHAWGHVSAWSAMRCKNWYYNYYIDYNYMPYMHDGVNNYTCSFNSVTLPIGSDESEQQYDQLCPWEQSQPVPDTDDPTYSHIHREGMDNTVEQLLNKL